MASRTASIASTASSMALATAFSPLASSKASVAASCWSCAATIASRLAWASGHGRRSARPYVHRSRDGRRSAHRCPGQSRRTPCGTIDGTVSPQLPSGCRIRPRDPPGRYGRGWRPTAVCRGHADGRATDARGVGARRLHVRRRRPEPLRGVRTRLQAREEQRRDAGPPAGSQRRRAPAPTMPRRSPPPFGRGNGDCLRCSFLPFLSQTLRPLQGGGLVGWRSESRKRYGFSSGKNPYR